MAGMPGAATPSTIRTTEEEQLGSQRATRFSVIFPLDGAPMSSRMAGKKDAQDHNQKGEERETRTESKDPGSLRFELKFHGCAFFLIKSIISSIRAPGVKTSDTPASLSLGMSSSGIIPPPKITTSSSPCCRASSTTRGKIVM